MVNSWLTSYVCAVSVASMGEFAVKGARVLEFITNEPHMHDISADIVRMWLGGYECSGHLQDYNTE